ncbi:aldehyde dehydrogenase family protein [Streptomyces griseomycini]|uniref:Acyl-CoA reductase-like NAD-dependent aldehyde dehydrogenase n=1 Tax=Streptomyces griseomycini TaxID=66895 RepID=A0A7W7PQH1_9ACTN|nr:aldehyde dehydrogenase family protein [Streptomyces griseomycini]MBB4898577.1 acyl-CoA reductase-like NAD-dependent aldehyde dehydrogenase [Streptomyces griseomycini]GGQ02450.1 salicylaldehyde dehydrogenase [Streptomyces griseomycini]GGR20164.1 salicylaldehyde dehydrogenase [Streptomyces griseomycini]
MSLSRGLVINGREVPASSGRTASDVSPWTGAVCAEVAAGTPDDVRRAVDAADAAFGAWAATKPAERRRILLRAAQLMAERTDEVVRLMAAEVGGVAPWAGFNAHLAADILLEAAAEVSRPTGQVLATDADGVHSAQVRVPKGVIAAISPWNAPVILGVRAVAMPIALGNTVVMKPSEDAPIACGLLISDVLHEAGLPAGVLNVVTNDRADAAEVVSALIADPRVRMVNFTGSTEVGRAIGVQAARHLKPAVLELGGKNALLVLQDADVDYAVDAAVFGSFMNAGQICMCVDRVIVHRAVADEFTARFAARVRALPCGDPGDPGTAVGPVVNEAAARRVSALIADAVSRGAELAAGTGEIEEPGTLIRPVVLTGVTEDMKIYHDEIFGPATVVHVVDDADEAVALANDTPYGLTAGVITENLAEGLEVAGRLRTGIVHVNDQSIADEPQAPFGGVRNSGYGRFGGQAGAEAFTDTRWVTAQARGHAKFPI